MAVLPAGLADALRDRYRLDRELGHGGMATVYLAQDLKHGRPVALKILRPELAAILGPQRFLQEIELTASLAHPHILPLHDSGLIPASDGWHTGLPYYTMPYVEGESLRARLAREKQLPLDDALQIAREVADALSYAHEHGILHRDIKPENILLEGGHAVVADFGIAKALSAATANPDDSSAGMAVGTPAYMSPEQAGGGHPLDRRSDIYALGCVLYEMLAGQPPFTGATGESLARQHMAAPVPSVRVLRPGVSPAVERAIRQSLAKAPADRFASAKEFAQALGRPGRPALPTGHRWLRPAAALIGLVALAGLVFLLLRGGVPFVSSDAAGRVSAQELPRIAVLYFDFSPPDSALDLFAGDLTEELIRDLGGVKAFRVVSRNGVRAFRDRKAPFDSIVAALGVNTVVDGSVRRLGDQLQVRAQLIDARSGMHVDTVSLEWPMPGRPPLGREVAQQLSAGLRRTLGRNRLPGEMPGTASARARDLVLKARRARDDAEVLAGTPHPEDLPTAIETLRRADSLLVLAQAADTAWVRPVIERGWVQYLLAPLLNGRDRDAALQGGIGFAEEAVRRSPEDPLALELRGALLWKLVGDRQGGPEDSMRLQRAERDLRGALDRDSTLDKSWATLSLLLWFRGRTAEAEIAARHALEEDAFLRSAGDVYRNLFFADLMLGNFSLAGEWCRRGQLSFPADWSFLECELTLMRHNAAAPPDPDSAWALVRELDRLDPLEKARAEGREYHSIYRRVVAATISARAGHPDVARTELARARRQANRDPTLRTDLGYDEAYLWLVLGERQRAAALLEAYIKARPMTRDYIGRDPLFSSLRNGN